MAWEYLEKKEMDERYSIVSETIGDCSGLTIADFNSGNSRFINYLKGENIKYFCGDLYDNRAKFKGTDVEFLDYLKLEEIKVDVLSCFGIGGYEISGVTLESTTISNTLKKAVSDLKPSYVILESIEKYLPILKGLEENIKPLGYNLIATKKVDVIRGMPCGLEYCGKRHILILHKEVN
jgi:hypothetical protein